MSTLHWLKYNLQIIQFDLSVYSSAAQKFNKCSYKLVNNCNKTILKLSKCSPKSLITFDHSCPTSMKSIDNFLETVKSGYLLHKKLLKSDRTFLVVSGFCSINFSNSVVWSISCKKDSVHICYFMQGYKHWQVAYTSSRHKTLSVLILFLSVSNKHLVAPKLQEFSKKVPN